MKDESGTVFIILVKKCKAFFSHFKLWFEIHNFNYFTFLQSVKRAKGNL